MYSRPPRFDLSSVFTKDPVTMPSEHEYDLFLVSLDVGNGNFTILAKGSQCIIIDVGLDPDKKNIQGKVTEDAKLILSRFSLEAIIITHKHMDHYALLSSIKDIPGNNGVRIYYPNSFSRNLNDLLPGVQIELILPHHKPVNSTIPFDQYLDYQIDQDTTHESDHLLVYIKYGRTSIFFPGDASPRTLPFVNKQNSFSEYSNVTVYFWQHHGSKYNGKNTLYHLNPKCVIFSSSNSPKTSSSHIPYGHPSESIVKIAKEMVPQNEESHFVTMFPDKILYTSGKAGKTFNTNSAIYSTGKSFFTFEDKKIAGLKFALNDDDSYIVDNDFERIRGSTLQLLSLVTYDRLATKHDINIFHAASNYVYGNENPDFSMIRHKYELPFLILSVLIQSIKGILDDEAFSDPYYFVVPFDYKSTCQEVVTNALYKLEALIEKPIANCIHKILQAPSQFGNLIRIIDKTPKYISNNVIDFSYMFE